MCNERPIVQFFTCHALIVLTRIRLLWQNLRCLKAKTKREWPLHITEAGWFTKVCARYEISWLAYIDTPCAVLTPSNPFCSISFVRRASRSSGIPSSGPYWQYLASSAAFYTLSRALCGGPQYTMPCANDLTSGRDYIKLFVKTMHGSSVANIREENCV